MPIHLSPDHIASDTPMGARLQPGTAGATFRVWAPRAREIKLLWNFTKQSDGTWKHSKEGILSQTGNERWGGFVPRIKAGETYMFYVTGPENGTEGLKRDPYARDLTDDPMWPECFCLLDDPAAFTWHDDNWKPPMFHEMIIYQIHIGTWYIPNGRHHCTFPDVIERLPYLKSLGINALLILPVVEFPTIFSLGYNGVDYFSPETDYGIPQSDPELNNYLAAINNLLRQINPGSKSYSIADITGTANQFRMMVDMCHMHGIAVIPDVVYNHAGGGFGDRSIYYFDRLAQGDNNDSLYFTDAGHAGGLVFAYWNDNVTQFLIDNAVYYLKECHCDGLRYDQVSVIKNDGGEHGWKFCRHVTDTCHYVKPEAIHIAESWPVEQAIVTPTGEGGAGFDAAQNDGLRDAIRCAIGQAAAGSYAFIDMDRIARELASPNLKDSWRAMQCSENHDLVFQGRGWRIAKIADGNNSRSWYARSRSRIALGLTITAPGIPHIFMGQEILEDKQWSDEPGGFHQIWWDGLQQDKSMQDFLRFSSELISVRNRLPGLRGSGLNVFHVHNENRILAFHRWVSGIGNDVVVIASLNESTFWGYNIGMPISGYWHEAFNSDVYDNWINPMSAGNGGGIYATGSPMHNLPASARIIIPANGLLIFTR
ncbi:MAG: alpha amylase C-terminal domain-containing protein [Acidobacteria bacterium]|nr:alpha amylase C-terminal domain-containing protein [Acidobacteriota bacterium]